MRVRVCMCWNYNTQAAFFLLFYLVFSTPNFVCIDQEIAFCFSVFEQQQTACSFNIKFTADSFVSQQLRLFIVNNINYTYHSF